MRIAEIRVYRIDLPVLGGPYRMALSELTALDSTVVEIVADNGLIGYGESCPLGPVYQPQHAGGARAALAEMAPGLIGCDPRRIGALNLRMDRLLAGHRYAKAAIDVALWDLTGRAYGARVCDLLGGALRESLPSYYAIGILPPEQAARVAREKQAQGFRRLQLKVGGRDIDEDIAAVRLVCESLEPGVSLAADANRGWTRRDVLLLSQACREQRFVIEQPCASYEECLSLRGRLCHPLYLDEVVEDLPTVLRAIGDRAADGFGMKLSRVGGLSAMRSIRDVCAVAGLPMSCDDSWGGDIAAAACLHIGATVQTHLCEGVWVAAPYIEGHYDAIDGPHIEAGQLRLPGGPGLGIAPRAEALGEPVASYH